MKIFGRKFAAINSPLILVALVISQSPAGVFGQLGLDGPMGMMGGGSRAFGSYGAPMGGMSSTASAVNRIGAAMSGESGIGEHVMSAGGAGLAASAAGGLTSGLGGLSNGLGGLTNSVGGLANGVGGFASNVLGGVANNLGGLGGLVGNGGMSPTTGAVNRIGAAMMGESGQGEHLLSNGLGLATGPVSGLVTGLAAATGSSGISDTVSGLTGGVLGLGNNLVNGLALGGAGPVGAAMASSANEAASLGSGGVGSSLDGSSPALAAAAAASQASGHSSIADAAIAPAIAAGLGPELAMNNYASNRFGLAASAHSNAQAESAIAGADMAAHSANNARSASLASNAYRQAKLASARDRVNVAGTIQNAARISDATIATHDASIKAEDSLLGSELAVDSAATVLDSDAAYIPPVTNSLLRSLPYGRLGLRNILPKPLTYPSHILPDVWLNGLPVTYHNVPLRALQYGSYPFNPLWARGFGFGTPNGFGLPNGQPYLANNGMPLNSLYVDPGLAYYNNINGIIGSSFLPILANGQLEAQDELALANTITNGQLNGPGMVSTYNGFGKVNSVPLLTGSVSDINLAPTTTIGTTYPIGSALVIEPRDSYFQDYADNASSRQNWDERQQ